MYIRILYFIKTKKSVNFTKKGRKKTTQAVVSRKSIIQFNTTPTKYFII
jgi:hypothetical protein